MNILFSSDDNYSRHLGVAILSILLHDKKMNRIRFYIINNHISLANIEKLKSLVHDYENVEMDFIPFDSFEKQLHLNLSWPISLSSYARLFVGEMLPAKVERVLYLDCDVVVNDSLWELWNFDLKGNCLGAIQDTIPSGTKKSVGLLPQQKYFNAGVLLIDLKRWRERGIGQKCMKFIEFHEGHVTHHDQGVLNGVLKDQWERLPLKYNVMTIHYMISKYKVKRFFKDKSPFYDDLEIEESVKKPVVLHFTPSFTTRPWEHNCCHPLKDCYHRILETSPWRGYPITKDNNPWYVRLLNIRYRLFPII